MSKFVIDIRHRDRMMWQKEKTEDNWQNCKQPHRPDRILREPSALRLNPRAPCKCETDHDQRQKQFEIIGRPKPDRIVQRQERLEQARHSLRRAVVGERVS